MEIHKVESKRNAQERLKAEGFGDKTKTEALEATKAKQDVRIKAFKKIKEHDIYAAQAKAKQHQGLANDTLSKWTSMFSSKSPTQSQVNGSITPAIQKILHAKADDARVKVTKKSKSAGFAAQVNASSSDGKTNSDSAKSIL